MSASRQAGESSTSRRWPSIEAIFVALEHFTPPLRSSRGPADKVTGGRQGQGGLGPRRLLMRSTRQAYKVGPEAGGHGPPKGEGC